MNLKALLLLAIVGSLAPITATRAQEWPSRPIHLVIPFEPGAGTNAVHRFYAEELAKALNQTVVVENVAGAGGAIGATRVARAEPDGYTLLGTVITNVAALPHQAQLPFDPLKDFVPVVRLADPISLIGFNADQGINTLAELISSAKASPGKYTFASAGIGTIPQFRFEELKAAAGIDLLHVPYKGGSAFVNDLLAGRVHLIADGSIALSLGKAGKIKVLAVLDDARLPELPDVPAITEIVPNYKVPPGYQIVLAPKGTPAPIVARLKAEMTKISQMSRAAEFLANVTYRPMTDSPSMDLNAELARTYKFYGELTQQLQLKTSR